MYMNDFMNYVVTLERSRDVGRSSTELHLIFSFNFKIVWNYCFTFFFVKDVWFSLSSSLCKHWVGTSTYVTLEVCKPVGTRHAESIRAGLGTFCFFTDRARAHLASLLYLCPYRPTRRAHMTVWNTDYIINITETSPTQYATHIRTH